MDVTKDRPIDGRNTLVFNRKDSSAPTSAPQSTAVPESSPPPRSQAPSVEDLLVPGEELVSTVETDNRNIVVTNRRLIFIEQSGDWSVVARDQISAFEVSASDGESRFVKVMFGGGLSRTVKTRTAHDAVALTSVVAS